MDERSYAGDGARPSSFFYGWYIVGVGILVNIAGTFAFSSTLSIFLKPITEELGVSRGAFSLIRTFEIGIAALIVPLLGPWIDRHGGRGVLVLGVLMEGTGLLLSGLVQSFWQFVLVRCSLVIAGEALLGSLVMNVTIAQWFVRKRGRAMGIANLGTGVAKLSIPLCAAYSVCACRMAQHMGYFRHRRTASSRRAGAHLHAQKTRGYRTLPRWRTATPKPKQTSHYWRDVTYRATTNYSG